jgi:hypothetical protein
MLVIQGTERLWFGSSQRPPPRQAGRHDGRFEAAMRGHAFALKSGTIC